MKVLQFKKILVLCMQLGVNPCNYLQKLIKLEVLNIVLCGQNMGAKVVLHLYKCVQVH